MAAPHLARWKTAAGALAALALVGCDSIKTEQLVGRWRTIATANGYREQPLLEFRPDGKFVGHGLPSDLWNQGPKGQAIDIRGTWNIDPNPQGTAAVRIDIQEVGSPPVRPRTLGQGFFVQAWPFFSPKLVYYVGDPDEADTFEFEREQ